MTKDGKLISIYPSASEAARQLGCHIGTIAGACRKGYKIKNYKWTYGQF